MVFAVSCSGAANPTPTPTGPATASQSPTATASRVVPSPVATPAATPSPVPNASAAPCLQDPALEAFAVGLMIDLTSRDAQRIASRMSDTFDFVVANTDVPLPPMSVDMAVHALLDGLSEPFVGYYPVRAGSAIACVPGVTAEIYAPKNDILRGFYMTTFLTTGWGTGGRDDAFVYVSTRPDGTPAFRGVWYAPNGFVGR
jgi:hypothetical protein